ncbi:MAG: glycogen debranching enzyme N-terminal domain-containing protein [Lentisphaeria bacterium]|nr:glycogen debranching enzyme N-terminal domain-containing protein [Lentisphaeria bacterium]
MSSLSFPLILEQRPASAVHTVRHVGDSLRITLTLSSPRQGKAYIRTNLGNAEIQRQEIIYKVENGVEPLGRDWRDIPMRRLSGTAFEIRLPLTEVGIFEYKCFFVGALEGKPGWPRGEDAEIKVITALGVAGNTIYNAFVRQFGRNLSGGEVSEEVRKAADLLDQENYTVIPPSGTFRAVKSKLDFIIGEMGFRILQFLPVHPTPTVFARMGRYGSPFAPLDFFNVDASMAEFDQRTTPLEQFLELVDQIHGRGALVFLDLPIDHTGWASVMQAHNPEWFARTADGAFESPGAWGVVWADLCKLDFSNMGLWRFFAEVFLHWCRNGVDGFRCDAGYMIPASVWKYIIAKVRQQFPDTIFFLEGLGGGQEATTRLLGDADLDWAYSELFQNYSSHDISRYLEFATGYSAAYGALVNFAETHDNDRLAAKSPAWARLRVALAALFAPEGCFGIANGVEWLAKEKIDVHEARSLNWGAAENMIGLLAQLNKLLKAHPAFRAGAQVRVPYGAGGDAVGILRVPADMADYAILVVANPSCDAPAHFHWHFQEFDAGSRPVDLLTGRPLVVGLEQCLYRVQLNPGQVVCLVKPGKQRLPRTPYDAVEHQQLRAIALKLYVSVKGNGDLGELDVGNAAKELFQSPREYLRKLLGAETYFPVVEWNPDTDCHRQTMIPEGHYLLIVQSRPFKAGIAVNGVFQQRFHSVPCADGHYFVFFRPLSRVIRESAAQLYFCGYDEEKQSHRQRAELLLLPYRPRTTLLRRISRRELTRNHCALATTSLGGYGLVRGAWGTLDSQYDALLAANQNPDYPVDRTVVLPRVRAWLVHNDFAQEITLNCQVNFAVTEKNSASWRFIVPTGVGGNVYLGVRYELDRDQNRCRLIFSRCPVPEEVIERMPVDVAAPVTLILRPDVDDCCNHNPTLAYQGAERDFPRRIVSRKDGFDFALSSGNRLETRISEGAFLPGGEWTYSYQHRLEGERGLRANRDLYCPGHFRSQLAENSAVVLEAAVLAPGEDPLETPSAPARIEAFQNCADISLKNALEEALDAFVVQRKPWKTIVAGYPWFLDWGRDTLICLRGLIAAGRLEDALATIVQFASFEEKGTLPNMIAGVNVSNRDTVDAPLWLFTVVDEYLQASRAKPEEVLKTRCGKRTLLDVLKSIVSHYQSGTPNGICVDKESQLVYSPAHFTWMDTNYPAGTPREGYPVEIQALWYRALDLLARNTSDKTYGESAEIVRQSVAKYFVSKSTVGLSDCLHAERGVPAAKAVADDACRPNQLFALTMPGLITDRGLREMVLNACSHLLVPGGIRTLAEQRVDYPLPVYHDGHLLNNPAYPYWGEYAGDEDTRRKPAYHNGTAWPWAMPSYCEALLQTYGESARSAARAIFGTVASTMRRGCLGQLPEIMDGNVPHTPKGCCAQAWSVTEAYRLLRLLEE